MMSEQQFDAKLKHIEDQAAARHERADGYCDQEMARLFLKSGWSQEKLAARLAAVWEKEVSPDWVSKRLRFGRFLTHFNTDCIEDDAPGAQFILPPNLTEGGFRALWDATEASGNFSGHKANTEAAAKDERRRFGEVVEALKGIGLRRKGQPVKRAILNKVPKDQWFTVEEIRERVAAELDNIVTTRDVRDSLHKHMKPTPKDPYRLEQSGDGEEAKYRVVKVKGRVVDRKQRERWSAELIPLLDDLIREANKDRVEISIAHLAATAAKIKKVLESQTAQVPVTD